ncbi:MAG TPA: zinc finger domain-containing protein, partial [Egibacteraceae bacterium]|nr:zinc finger domain-containing protein [Egibacteraceae bacterium]
LSRAQLERDPSVAALGPDALDEETDLSEAGRRLQQRGDWTIGEALLDQRVLAGVGNVYKSEVLFIHRVDPWTPVAEVPGEVRDQLLATAERLLKDNVRDGAVARTTTPPGTSTGRLFVYGRARRPCARCATPIRRARQGEQARLTYWCPRCQGPGP